ncbi:hypothetical protein [Planococcus sp. YIM B11945]|uniref:hypothetical protein n=1 Tax=Planococcus sp. YIM B11945 TaxID=3435410 RepID=UPI003D7E8CFF
MKLAWSLYLIGLVLVIIYYNTGSDLSFFTGIIFMITGFVIRTINKKKNTGAGSGI